MNDPGDFAVGAHRLALTGGELLLLGEDLPQPGLPAELVGRGTLAPFGQGGLQKKVEGEVSPQQLDQAGEMVAAGGHRRGPVRVTAGHELVGRLRVEPGGAVERAVLLGELERWRAVSGVEKGEALRIERGEDGAVTRMVLSGYPMMREPGPWRAPE